MKWKHLSLLMIATVPFIFLFALTNGNAESKRFSAAMDERSLQKEVWEDDGVMVTRSLDMFISKLRKKLEKDPSVKLVNIHGKGYKLEVNPL